MTKKKHQRNIIIQIALLIGGLFLYCCSRQQSQTTGNFFSPKVVEAHGYIVSKDSMAVPKVILVDEKKLKKIPVGKPKVVLTNTNIHIAITTNIHKARSPRICMPGKDSFQLPKTVPALDTPRLAGIPEVTLAKDPHINDNNPQSVSSFSKLQGLKDDVVSCILQDNRGNLWFGTDGGVSKYDGKFFTHFTVKEGLSNNTVWSILEDKNGNLWFGTSGGVSKYDGRSFTNFTVREGLSNNTVLCILEDRSGNLWFGTNGGGVNKYDGNRVEAIEAALQRGEIIPQRTQQDLKRINGKLVKSFTHFTINEGLSNNSVKSILEDKSENLWFGTSGGGVNKYDGKSFTHFTDKDGLSRNFVKSILEDKSGNLWFGIYGGGVNKYDGNRVEAIEAALQRGEIIPQQTQNDLKKINGKFVKTFTHFAVKEGLSNNTVWSMLEDKSGNLWFGTYGGGVNKYDGKSFTYFTNKEGLSNNTVVSLLEDKTGNFWFGTFGGGVNKYDGGTAFTHFTDKEGLSNNTVRSILEDKSGNLWFGTYGGGVNKYDGHRVEAIEAALQRGEIISQKTQQDLKRINGKLVKSFTYFTVKEGLSNNIVWSILEDKSGNLWFGTAGGGVNKYDGKSFTHFTNKEGLSSNTVVSMLEDKSGNIWFGTAGGGVDKYDGNRVETIEAALQRGEIIPQRTLQDLKKINEKFVKSFTHFTVKEGLSNNTVWSILEDISGNLWFGTDGGGVNKYDGKSFTHFTVKEGLSNNYLRSIIEDKSGNLWFGTDGGGISKYDGNRVEAIEAALQRGEIIPQQTQRDLKKINGKLVKCFTHFTDKEGLSNNTVLSILEDKSGNLWFGTRFGLARLSYSELVFFSDKIMSGNLKESEIFFKNYIYDDGFYGIGCNGGNSGKNILQDKKGIIWVGANDRLTAFHPQGDVEDTIPPNVQLTSIALFNENIKWADLSPAISTGEGAKSVAKDTSFILGNGVTVGNFEFDGLTRWYCLPENLSLAYNNNYLTFNYIGIIQKQSKKVKYQYKLEGINENWSALSNRTEAAYGNLSPGNYTFKVKALNSEGYWSNEYNYTFAIRPPWWKTWWMYSVYGITTIILVVLIVWWNGRRLRAKAIELTEEVRKATVVIREEKEKVELANVEISEQKKVVEKKNKNITDSITYAQCIQQSILMEESEIQNYFPDLFIYYKPKDIVSGDFYWCSEIDDKIILAVVDCTGHGVPGAFMSMIGNTLLNQIVNEKHITKPSEILRLLNLGVYETLHQNKEGALSNDGMDIALCSIDLKNKSLEYAGAQNPLFIVSDNQIEVIKADIHDIGGGGLITKMHDPVKKEFANHVIPLKKGTSIYLFSDGYMDQFGGRNNKKFGTKQFKDILLTSQHLSMQEQKELIASAHTDWKGNTPQIDDVLVMGIRVL